MAAAYHYYETEKMEFDDEKLKELFNNYETKTDEEIKIMCDLIKTGIRNKYRNPDSFIPEQGLPIKEYLYFWLLRKDFINENDYKKKAFWLETPARPLIIALLFEKCDIEEVDISNVDEAFYDRVRVLRKRLENNDDLDHIEETDIITQFTPKIMILKWLFTDNPNEEWYTECDETIRKRSITTLKLDVRMILRDLGCTLFHSPVKTSKNIEAEKAQEEERARLEEEKLNYFEPRRHSSLRQRKNCPASLFQEDRREDEHETEPIPLGAQAIAPLPAFEPLAGFIPVALSLPNFSFVPVLPPQPEPKLSGRLTPTDEALNRDFEKLRLLPREVSPREAFLNYSENKFRNPELLEQEEAEAEARAEAEEKKKERELQEYRDSEYPEFIFGDVELN